MSRLSRFADGLMEAAWLAALIGTPVFFDVYSSRIFEPDKITLLRSLAWLALAAWMLKILAQGGIQWQYISKRKKWWRSALEIPLVVPVLALSLAYLLATVFSVAPRTSLWGSYQRLQGTYTTFAYLVIFAVVAGNLRRREQVERIMTVVILSGLAVSLYGVLQHYGLDPVPWGGNVQNRIAANMGNSIFVAAYLIMAVPLGVARVVESLRAIMRTEDDVTRHIVRATMYIFILALQMIAIYFSGSRGPFLGLVAGLFFFFLLVAMRARQRWLALGTIGLAVAGALFLAVLNIPNGPLETLRESPWVGRFGHLADTNQRTSKVRQYIWQGASKLVAPHDPIAFPDGSTDRWNALRPLIGYGPESMYVAYNRFYPPELGQVEKRNASPDRSHNETWDALVTTGALGLVVYLLVFGSVFYYGFRWLGLITTPAQRNTFIALFLGGGVVGAVGLVAWQGIAFLGVGLPFGILLGLGAYITLRSLQGYSTSEDTLDWRTLVMTAFLTAILAHFVEIHFGIAIVSTRTHFWVYAAVLLVMGFVLPREAWNTSEDGVPSRKVEAPAKQGRRRRSRGGGRPAETLSPWGGVWTGGILSGIFLMVLGFDYISNLGRSSSAGQVFWHSLTRLPMKHNAVSYGILALVLTVWAVSALLFATEERAARAAGMWRSVAGIAGLSLLIGLIFWGWQSGRLAALSQISPTNQQQLIAQLRSFEGLLTTFYFFGLAGLFAAALVLPEAPQTYRSGNGMAAVAAPFLLIAVMVLATVTNLRIIQADIAFKMADPFTRGNQWPVAMVVYQHAIDLAPNEDYYYLFLGRAYLEQAKNLKTVDERRALFQQAEKDLKTAQRLNPLNTDHTANLARLYSWWASATDNAQERQEYAQRSNVYYEKALSLSPNNVVLWGEWATLDLNFLKQPEAGLEKLNHALELDDTYDRTYALLGDYYLNQARGAQDSQQRTELLTKAVENYQRALDVTPRAQKQTRYLYNTALGGAYIELKQYPDAIAAYQEALQFTGKGNRWRLEESLARLYAQVQDKENAVLQASNALNDAPQSEKERLQTLLSQIQAMP